MSMNVAITNIVALITWTLLAALILKAHVNQAAKTSKYVKRVLENREHLLREIALSQPRTVPCSTTKFVELQFPYGRSGNHFMQFANMVWISEISQRTLIIPHNMVVNDPSFVFRPSLGVFNLTIAHQRFCFITSNEPHPDADIIRLGEESFNIQEHVYNRDPLASM